MKVGIIGAGWAGLAAAVSLHDAGHQVSIHEASATPGGRARRVTRPDLIPHLDNGQHILLGAYCQTLELMRRLGRNPADHFLRIPLKMTMANQSFELRCRNLPSPWHAIAGVLLACGWAWSDKWALSRSIAGLKRQRWSVEPDQTVASWLEQHRQPDAVVHLFWEPLCLAALNTPIRVASMAMLARVLGDSLDAGQSASDMLIPSTDLSDLWADHLPKGIELHTRSVIRNIEATPAGYTLNSEWHYDALVVATPPASSLRLLQALESPRENTRPLLAALQAFEPVPIATLNLMLETPWLSMTEPVLMLDDRKKPGVYGQWLFNHANFSATAKRRGLLSIVISDCRALMAMNRDHAQAELTQHVRQQTRRFGPMPAITNTALIIEKRATFAAVPNLKRPGNATAWPRLVLAGDWTDTGYPAVLEGAVRSGRMAAAHLIKH